MTFDLETLGRCAEWHERCAAVADAKAGEHLQAGELDDADKQQKRASGHRSYAESIRGALRVLKVKAKRGAFIPPSKEEALAYGKEIGMPKREIEGWYDHFESNGWKVSGRTVMSDWKAALRNGKRHWEGRTPRALAKGDPKDEDPEGWREFLKENGQPYTVFATALDFVKPRFEQWRAAR